MKRIRKNPQRKKISTIKLTNNHKFYASNKKFYKVKSKKHSHPTILHQAFVNKNIPIVFETSAIYIPILSVALESLIESSKQENNYDIIVLSNELSDSLTANLLDMVRNRKNFSLRFHNPEKLVEPYIKKAKHKYLDINYFRLALPWILSSYNRVINLGADVIIERDIADLFHESMGSNNYIAGGKDLGYQGRLYLDIPLNELSLEHPFDYVNADVLLMDLELIRSNFELDDMMQSWQQGRMPLRCAEQDVFNKLFDGHIHHLDLRWNTFADRMAGSDFTIAASHSTDIKIYKQALQNPYIVHFAAYPKPWDYPDIGYGFRWWYFAKKTVYYEELLRRMCVVNARGNTIKQPAPTLITKERRLIEWLLPINSKRRKIANFLVPVGSIRRHFLKRIQYFLTPSNERKKYGIKRWEN